MLKIRPGEEKDKKTILKILKDLDLFYPTLGLNDFWVAEKEGGIIGCVQLKEYKDFQFLGSLAIKQELQGQGLGKALTQAVLENQRKDVYLYTIIPDFFKKFNFTVTDTYPANLPSKDRFECEYCHLEKCAGMVRKHAS